MSSDIVNPVDTDVAIFTATTTLTSMLLGINQIVHENIVDANDYIRAASNYVKTNTSKIKQALKPAYTEYTEFVKSRTMNETSDNTVMGHDIDGDRISDTPILHQEAQEEPKKSLWKRFCEFMF